MMTRKRKRLWGEENVTRANENIGGKDSRYVLCAMAILWL
jgi:hypothetical protein